MKHIKYPKTGQFRTIVTTIVNKTRFIGLDDNGEPIYDELRELPIITAKGTIKLHGTNAGVTYNLNDGLYTQSRNNVLTLDKTSAHFGFTFFVKKNEEFFIDFIEKIAYDNNIDLNINTITIYGEWCGPGVQKTVAISEVPKSFYFFGAKVSNEKDDNFKNYWLNIENYRFDNENVFNIHEFETFEITIDFKNPQNVQNLLVEITEKVEQECPVAKQLGVSGIGEGVVWEFDYKGDRYNFKTKGDKHAGKSKTKSIKPVDNERINLLIEVAEEVTPTWRLNQMFNEVTNNGNNLERRLIGQYIKAVLNDVVEEDLDILEKHNIEPKEINKYISQISKNYFFEQEKL